MEMTVTKAVEILAAHKDGYDDYEEYAQALDLGIKALMKIKAIEFNIYALNRLMEDFDNGNASEK